MRRTLLLLVVLAPGLPAQWSSTDAMLGQLEGRRSGVTSASDIRALSMGLDMGARDSRTYDADGYGQRMQRSSRSLLYLNRARMGIGNDVSLGLAVAGAYQNVGAVQAAGTDPRYQDRRGALLSYQNSYMVLNQLAASNPDDPRIRGELVTVAGRIQGLGGSIPMYMRIPIGGGPPPAPTGIPDQVFPVQKGNLPSFDLPKLDWAKVPDDKRKACGEALERYIAAAAPAQSAFGVLDSVRISVESRGLGLRPEYLANASRLADRMNSAKDQIERQECEQANEPLGMAEAETRRLLKEFGQ
jgi:hypothetical protein